MFLSQSQSWSTTRLRSQALRGRGVSRPLILLAILAVGVMTVPLLVSPVHAVGTPTVFLTPGFRSQAASGSTVHYAVNVTNMPLFNGFNVFIKVDSTVLTPTSISDTGVIFAAPLQDINCVNGGAGIALGSPGNLGCTPADGPSIAHEEVACNGCLAQGNGVLFNVTFTSQTSSPASSVVDIYNDQILKPAPDLVPHLTTGGFYGSTTAPADFTIAASPFTQSIPQGLSGSVTITLTSVNGFTGTISVSVKSFPAALAAVTSLNTSSVSLAVGGTKFVGATISPTASTAGGPYDLVLNATATTVIALIHQQNAGVTVTVPDFSIAPSPASLVNALGSSNSSTLTLTSINQFSGVVTLSTTFFPSVANPPSILLSNSTTTASSVKVTVPAGGTVTATLTVSSTPVTTVSGYSITVHGVSGTLSRTATVPVSVVPFAISASPKSMAINRGSFATSTISLASVSNVASNVTLSTSTSGPTGATPPTATFSNSTIKGVTTIVVRLPAGGTNFVTLNETTDNGPSPPATTTGSYTVIVTGRVATALTASRSAQVTVSISGFSITSSPSSLSLTLPTTAFATSQLTLQSLNGFTGNVNLTTSVSPSGPTALLSNSTRTGLPSVIVKLLAGGTGSATLNVTITGATPAGAYTVTLTGTSGVTTTTVSVSVTVISFAFTLAHSPVAPSVFIAGASATSTITLTNTGSQGTVTLTTSVYPGANAPSAVVGNSTSSGTSFVVNLASSAVKTLVLTVSSTSSTAPGVYGVNVTATSTGTAKSFVVTVTVSAVPTISAVTVSPTGTATVGQTVTVTVTVANSGSATANFTLRVKWGSVTVVEQNETLGPGQTHSYQLSWDTSGLGVATDTVSAVILQDGAWSSTGMGPSYTLAAAPAPFFNPTTIIVIGVLGAAAALVSMLLLLRRRRVIPVA